MSYTTLQYDGLIFAQRLSISIQIDILALTTYL